MDEMNELEIKEMLRQLMSQQQGKGTMGFDQNLYDRAMSDPQAIEAGAEMAGLMDDPTSMSLMRMGENPAVPHGGQLGWTEALSNGIDKGLGMYNLLNAQKVKANALRAMGGNGAGDGAPASAFPVDMTNPVAKPLA